MRVAIDGRRLQDDPFGGVGRELARTLPLITDEAELTILTDARRPPPAVPGLASAEIVELRVPPRVPEAVWMNAAVPRWLHGWDGVFHGTWNQLPLGWSGHSVVTMHDLSFEYHPEDFSKAKAWLFRLHARAAAKRAGRIIVHSEVVRDDLIRVYGVERDRMLVAPIGVDPVFGPHGDDVVAAAAQRRGLSSPYVIAVGGARRRGLPVAVDAWASSSAPALGVDLVVVGTEAPAVRDGVHWVGRVPDDEWAVLLAGATALVYPTRFEGFGMPALEAIASGTPVVCARLDIMVEVLGGVAAWCATPTVEDTATALSSLLGDPSQQAELRRAGLARAAAAPGWPELAEATLRAYREAIAS